MTLQQKEGALQRELTFRRNETKFFISPKNHLKAADEIDHFCQELGFIKENHPNPITRSIYFLPSHLPAMPLGFTIRYREYVGLNQAGGKNLGNGQEGYYEIKWNERGDSNESSARKLRVAGSYIGALSLSELRNLLINHQPLPEERDNSSIEMLFQAISPDLSMKLSGTFVTEYERSRYVKRQGSKKNVISVDHGVHYYDGAPENIGNNRGLVVEYKESFRDTPAKLNLYRILIGNNAHYYYGKKAEALNIKQIFDTVSQPLYFSEVNGLLISGDLPVTDELLNFPKLTQAIYDLFGKGKLRRDYHIPENDSGIRSDTSIELLSSKKDSDGETEYLTTIKDDVTHSVKKIERKTSSNVQRATIDHMSITEYDRTEVDGFIQKGSRGRSVKKISNEFTVISNLSGRAYSISVVISFDLMKKHHDISATIVIGYQGVDGKALRSSHDHGNAQDQIENEIETLTAKIGSHLVNPDSKEKKSGSLFLANFENIRKAPDKTEYRLDTFPQLIFSEDQVTGFFKEMIDAWRQTYTPADVRRAVVVNDDDYLKHLRRIGMPIKQMYKLMTKEGWNPEPFETLIYNLGKWFDGLKTGDQEAKRMAMEAIIDDNNLYLLEAFDFKYEVLPIDDIRRSVSKRLVMIERFMTSDSLKSPDFHSMRKQLRDILILFEIPAVENINSEAHWLFYSLYNISHALGLKHDETLKEVGDQGAAYSKHDVKISHVHKEKFRALKPFIEKAVGLPVDVKRI